MDNMGRDSDDSADDSADERMGRNSKEDSQGYHNNTPSGMESPPPYSPQDENRGLAPPGNFQQYPPQSYPQQYPQQYAGTQQVAVLEVDQGPDQFAQQERLAECVRFWWCRPLGWLAKAQLVKARTLYAQGDEEGARKAAQCANIWSIVGLVSGIVLVAAVGVATYFIVSYALS